jgi:hypothetical protein
MRSEIVGGSLRRMAEESGSCIRGFYVGSELAQRRCYMCPHADLFRISMCKYQCLDDRWMDGCDDYGTNYGVDLGGYKVAIVPRPSSKDK